MYLLRTAFRLSVYVVFVVFVFPIVFVLSKLRCEPLVKEGASWKRPITTHIDYVALLIIRFVYHFWFGVYFSPLRGKKSLHSLKQSKLSLRLKEKKR